MLAWIMAAIICFVMGFYSESIAEALWKGQQGVQVGRAEKLAKFVFADGKVTEEFHPLRPMSISYQVNGQEHQVKYNPRNEEEADLVKPLQKFSPVYIYYNPESVEDIILTPTHDDAIAQVKRGTRARPKSKLPETIKTVCYVIGAFCMIVGAYKMTQQQGSGGRRR